MPSKNQQEPITLGRIERPTIKVGIRGTAPLIVHRWSDKARKMMLDKQMGKKPKKEVKDPQSDYEASMYRFPDGGHGFPTLAFKAATVGAGRHFNGVTMTALRQALHFQGVTIETGELLTRLDVQSGPVMREDMVRVGMGTADIRYRAMYPEWGAELLVSYFPNLIDVESVLALVDAGGMAGVGEWRPEKDGAFGTYEVTG